MNIKEYYSVMSRIYLNQVILVGLFLIGCLFLFGSVGFPFLFKWITTGVIMLLVYFFVRYAYFSFRGDHLRDISKDRKLKIINSNEQMMLFLPAPSLSIKFFKSNGICEYEIKEEKINLRKWYSPIKIGRNESKFYQFKKRDGLVMAKMKVLHRQGNIEITTLTNLKSIIQLKERKRNKLTFDADGDRILIHVSAHKMVVTKNNKTIAIIENGWMPIKWQRYFSPNTPILSFKEEVIETDQIIIYGLLILIFNNQ
ncbi:hypothetical protein [Heyndrickxia camelliae]|uniref:Uncharacterized protein n=1 Tax=Heyndrickxia camelliae TaxID=1707093 RepID=A0A2N3LMF9_9BACI|nr:hypothetical protein [Heyndrickxia camelliae]PKR85810.1 hypothetical protein CWO92_05370 [Heyndrickxia camelliae]